jgi:uncharacterized Zn-finger protein
VRHSIDPILSPLSYPNFTVLTFYFRKIHRPECVKLRFQCSACPKSFNSSAYLRDHMNVHSGKRPYKCPDCSATFMTQSVFSRHRQKHKSVVACPYEECGVKFRNLSEQVKHVNRVHSTAGTYVCSKCGKLFMDKDKMMSHACEEVIFFFLLLG